MPWPLESCEIDRRWFERCSANDIGCEDICCAFCACWADGDPEKDSESEGEDDEDDGGGGEREEESGEVKDDDKEEEEEGGGEHKDEDGEMILRF